MVACPRAMITDGRSSTNPEARTRFNNTTTTAATAATIVTAISWETKPPPPPTPPSAAPALVAPALAVSGPRPALLLATNDATAATVARA